MEKYPITLDQLLIELRDCGGSDLHIRAGEPPVFRIHGVLQRTQHPVFTPEQTKWLMYSIMQPAQREKYERDWEMDM
ncbi:MAG: type IV pili twitching motility protein PilT, partial [Armatimonadota bacterium]